MSCRHGDRGTCGMWNTRMWSSSACGHVSVCGGLVFLQVLVVLGTTDHAEVVAGGGQGTFGVVLSHALQTKEIGLLSLGFAAVDCCAVVADDLQAEFIYEHVEGAKAVANTRVGSVGIHDNIFIVRGQDEKLHEEPSRPAVVASHLVQTCDLVVLVHGSHVPETRGKVRVPGGRTFMQNCVKRSGGLTYLVFSTTSCGTVNCASRSPTRLFTVDALLGSW